MLNRAPATDRLFAVTIQRFNDLTLSRRTIYFAYNATTPLDPPVRDAMLLFLGEVSGNPPGVHCFGSRARTFLDDARDRVARVLGCKPSEVIFTSGGTESNNLAFRPSLWAMAAMEENQLLCFPTRSLR
jgi:cysteine sulfinate desulfinase/cysteine desulfurase-like protein